ELWRKYEHLTNDLAHSLTESLRLILTPTVATKLQGDYRTGKRLNMRKIIPYIASQYRKDKIWMRRTKPAQRQYQIMIAIDDSKSMRNHSTITLALETLALVWRAMMHAEAGQVSVVSFGERTRLLHPFDHPLTSEAGARVISQFAFDQDATNVASFIETTTAMFEQARRTQSSANGSKDLWQLQFIISDAICHSPERIKALVRKAAEEHRIMMVFIVIDNGKQSITETQVYSVTGKTVKSTPYMDTFPFEYYLVVREIETLPIVLSECLRQYF
ncbi:hypothetical protein GQ42DRAFT_110264, partial [Ramicandelaber brevisporus]